MLPTKLSICQLHVFGLLDVAVGVFERHSIPGVESVVVAGTQVADGDIFDGFGEEDGGDDVDGDVLEDDGDGTGSIFAWAPSR